MMKKSAYLIVLLGLMFSVLSCTREEMTDPAIGEGEAVVELKFGFKDFEQVKVETRATLDIIPESRVSNMFVFMFVGEKRYYAHYFDKSSLTLSLQDMRDVDGESWYVENRTETVKETKGALRIHVPICSRAEIYLIANIDSDMVNVSPDKLNMITTRSELSGMVAELNQEITSRNGLFPMTGTYVGSDGYGPGLVDVTAKGIFPTDETSGSVCVDLERLDAKVNVNVRIATDNELTETKDENGVKVTTIQRLREFRPESWQVVNLPKGTYLASHSNKDSDEGFFSTEPVMFETVGSEDFTYKDSKGNDQTVTSTVNGFSFYMLQNRQASKNPVEKFHERERRNKDAAGMYVTTGDLWTNAPENGTYMVIKGQVLMDVDVSSEAKQQQLSADVTYYVHLGNIGKDLDDYNVLRNTAYTYTITIKGVNKIALEVSTSYKDDDKTPADPGDVKEEEPGAEGMVYIAKESLYTFDAHYGQRVFCFDAAYVDPDAVTWYVKTPFGKEGTPEKIGDTEIPSGMDYEWVHFMVNKVSATDAFNYSYGGKTVTTSSPYAPAPYSHNNLAYPGDNSDKLMDVVQFVDYIKTQKRNQAKGLDNDFHTEFDQDWFDWYNKNNPDAKVSDPATLIDGKPGPWFRDRIYVTVFVDEFYYEEDPITGEKDPQLWKRFVNQPNRLMHVLCDNKKSLDKASSSTGSVVTICQRSIQTPYNINDSDLASAWGCETEDENADSYLWFYPKESRTNKLSGYFGNSSTYNGLYNTVRLWGCVSPNGSSWNELNWADYLDYDRPNDYKNQSKYCVHFLKDDKACFQYSAMMRNRDNNGNGVIDMNEVRWYDASIGQLEFLFFGELGLSDDAKLYSRKYSSAAKNDNYPAGHPYAGSPKWAVHVISSTNYDGQDKPRVLWAEEGVSISAYRQWGDYSYSVKCVRNLGFKTEAIDYFTKDDEDHRPQDLIVVEKPSGNITTSSVYKFNCRRVNDKSKRFKSSIELEPYDETSEMARLYDGFVTGELFSAGTVGVSNYKGLRAMLQKGQSPCPDGYRVPNIREVTLIHLFTDSIDWWGGGTSQNTRIYTSTYYSLGELGNKKNSPASNGTQRISWNTSSPVYGTEGNINLNGDKSSYIRCVRDWNPAEE